MLRRSLWAAPAGGPGRTAFARPRSDPPEATPDPATPAGKPALSGLGSWSPAEMFKRRRRRPPLATVRAAADL